MIISVTTKQLTFPGPHQFRWLRATSKSLTYCKLLQTGVFVQLCNNYWPGFSWHSASRGPSAIGELHVLFSLELPRRRPYESSTKFSD